MTGSLAGHNRGLGQGLGQGMTGMDGACGQGLSQGWTACDRVCGRARQPGTGTDRPATWPLAWRVRVWGRAADRKKVG